MTAISNSFQIGTVTVSPPTVMAPLAGITDLPLRRIAKKAGAGLVCSEMLSANGLVYQSGKTARMTASCADEKPLSVQMFGADPAMMAKAAIMVEETGADILDINFGCSVRKVVKTGSGVALMRTPDVAANVLTAVRKAISIPLTIKIRTGWTGDGDQALEIAKMAEDVGVDAIAVHPRTASQGFRGHSDWILIKKVRQAVSIPVIGNGDILCAADAIQMFDETGCHGVMIGRAAIGNPWLFGQIEALLNSKEPPPVTLEMIQDGMQHYLQTAIDYYGETHACRIMRSRLGWFVKGLSHNSQFRESIKQIATKKEATVCIDDYINLLETKRVGSEPASCKPYLQ